MKIGVPKEIKEQEYRVAITPAGVHHLNCSGHKVYIEKGAGVGTGISDSDFKSQGAIIMEKAEDIYNEADMIVKVKEPQEQEYPLLRENQILFTYLHLASSLHLTKSLLDRKIIGIAYETVENEEGELPLLIPMSEVAGKMAPQEGAKYLEKPFGGSGILLGGIPGVSPSKVLVIGGGTVGKNAALVAAGMGAEVIILEISSKKIRELSEIMPKNVKILYSTEYTLKELISSADMVIGAVLSPGAKAPKLIKREYLKTMRQGSVLVDVAIDQGGCAETSRATTHSEPVYEVDGVIHYCVANMPGAVPRTSTYGLTNATLAYIAEIAQKGWKKAVLENPYLAKGVNICKSYITYYAVAKEFNLPYKPLKEVLSSESFCLE